MICGSTGPAVSWREQAVTLTSPTNEESFMSMPGCSRCAVLLIVAFIGLTGGKVSMQEVAKPVNDLPNPYETLVSWGTLPDGRTWGSTGAVNVDPDGVSIW